jgi:hypothetical protein
MSKEHSHPVEQSQALVRTAKESQQARDTHILSSTEQGTGQDSNRKPAMGTHILSRAERETGQESKGKLASEGHSPTVKHRARDWSGQ